MGKVTSFLKENIKEGAESGSFILGAAAGRSFAKGTIIPSAKKGFYKTKKYFNKH